MTDGLAQRWWCVAAAGCLAMVLVACGGGADGGSDEAVAPAVAWRWELPSYLPAPRVPADNPMSAAKVELGRHLFYDKRLSGNGTQSCASCHFQHLAFSDGRAVSVGSTGEPHVRSAMPLGNVAWYATYTWANPVLISLEAQMTNPLFGEMPVEMGVNESTTHVVLERLRADPRYPPLFDAAFPDAAGERIHWDHIVKAIASFQRALVTVDSKYDRHLQGRTVLTPAEANGLAVFNRVGCVNCHSGPNFTDQFLSIDTTAFELRYHNKGLYNLDGKGAYPEESPGVIEITGKPADMGKYRVPSLRNIEVTAPYMHDGSVATLAEVVALYAAGGRNVSSGPHAGDGRASPLKSPDIRRREISAQDQADLVAFLKTLTDHAFLSNPKLADPFGPTPGLFP